MERLFQRLGHRYILAVLLLTRLSGGIAGALVVYYVNLILNLPPTIRDHFHLVAFLSVFVVIIITTVIGIWETRGLRAVLFRLFAGQPISESEGLQAGFESAIFANRHHRIEAWVVPCTTGLPVLLFLWFVDNASWTILFNIVIAVFIGIALALIFSFFLLERAMQPVVRHLMHQRIPFDWELLPSNRLKTRLNVCFSLIVMTTALMIGTLATQRANAIIDNPDTQVEAVANLRQHTGYITLVALASSLLFSSALSNSVASRVNELTSAIKRVGDGSLTERLEPTGNDEVDNLARGFNNMVEQLDRNDRVIRDLNTNLERKVRQRTEQLSRNKQRLQRSLKRLKQYDRMKTDFFSNVSHELRTPLTLVLSPLERILEKHQGSLPEEVTRRLEGVRVNGHRLYKLINQVLQFSKLEAGSSKLTLGQVDLNRIVKEITLAAAPLAEQRGIKFEVDLQEALPAINADEEKIDNVISNLVSNALKFTPKGGRVVVRSERVEDWAHFSVQDSGIGIAPRDQHKIFDRFVQVDSSASREFAGTGLGLAMAKELVELHGGNIGVESELNHGSTFWFRLPALANQNLEGAGGGTSEAEKVTRFAELVETPKSDTMAVALPEKPDAPTVLVVDDSAEIRNLIGDILSEDYNVVFGENGHEGEQLANRITPDMIISDVMMPKVNGYDFCRAMKGDPATAHIPFVLLTAKAEITMKIEGWDCGADGYLVKPFDTQELRALVRSLLKLRKLYKQLDERNSRLEHTLKELGETQAQLVHSAKLTSLGQLVAGLAHEINNSINAVYNSIVPLNIKTEKLRERVETLIDNGLSSKEDRDYITDAFDKISSLTRVMENGASRTVGIVLDLKTFSHPGSEDYEDFDLKESLEMCINLLFKQRKNRIVIHRDLDGVTNIKGPRSQLNQVFMNILCNAQQALGESGEIWMSSGKTEGEIEVRIRDNGPGIPEEIRQQIFDPFFTTKPPGIGTGLGLSISYSIVKNIGGSIECQSEIGEGTAFVIRWPRTKKSARRANPAAPAIQGSGVGQDPVLLPVAGSVK